jgi:branched-subunit amino acid transport protein
LLFLLVGAGNYLMRFLPLLWTLRRRDAGSGDEVTGKLGGLLSLVGPSVVAALLVTSVFAEAGNAAGLVRTGIALSPTVIVAVRFGNLGLTVLVGVVAYWLASLMV